MSPPLCQSDFEAYLDEALPSEEMARIEHALRRHPEYVDELAAINARRNAGMHTLGEIWRRHRLGCPARERLGSYLLGAVPDEEAAHIAMHVDVVGCRLCQASLKDLSDREQEAPPEAAKRRRKYFQSSARYLGKKKG